MRHKRWINKVLLFALIIAILSWPIQANASGSYSYYMPVTIQSSEVDEDPYTFSIQGEGTEPVTMADPSVTISADIEGAIEDALNSSNPYPSADMYAVTSISTRGDYSMASVVGITGSTDPSDWSYYQAAWTGTALVRDNGDTTYTSGIQDTSTYNTLLNESTFSDPTADLPVGGSGSSDVWFPFQAGTAAMYGPLGVHDAARSLPGWKAVDFVGMGTQDTMPNIVYAAQTGRISNICIDGTQMGFKAGDFYYLHLEPDSNYEPGDLVVKGQPMGSLITGDHNTRCGYTDHSNPTHYHLHFGFKPEGDHFVIENWILNINTGIWSQGDQEKHPDDFITAYWDGQDPIYLPTPTPGGDPTPTPTGGGIPRATGGHIWDAPLNGLVYMTEQTANRFPEATNDDLTSQIASGAQIAVSVAFTMLSSNFDLRISLIVFGLVAALEGARFIYAIVQGVKDLIPFM